MIGGILMRKKHAFPIFIALLVLLISACSSPKPPKFEIPDQRIEEGSVLRLSLTDFAEASTNEKLSFELKEGKGKIEGNNYLYSASFEDSGTSKVIIIAKTDKGKETEAAFNLIIEDKNRSPIISIDNLELSREGELTLDLKKIASDPDGDSLSFFLSSGKGTIESYKLKVVGKDLDYGENKFSVQVIDTKGATALTNFSIVVPLPSVVDSGNTLYAGLGGDYETIQQAVSAAKTGDTVFILPGNYTENISISKSIHIVGSSRDEVVISASNESSAIIYVRNGNGVKISGLTLKTLGPAIQFSRSSGEINDCIIKGGRFGVSFSGSSGTYITVTNCTFSALESEYNPEKLGERLTGLYAYGTGKVEVANSVFVRNGTGLYLSNEITFKVLNSTFDQNTIGISITGTANGLIRDNLIMRNMDNGILLRSTSTVEFENNRFLDNIRHGFDLYLKSCTDCGCGGTVFNGTVLGSGNVFDDEKAICPRDFSWPEGFYKVDEQISKAN
jgi:parallel beta-helix repeat protein